jgi:hypothetical protein
VAATHRVLLALLAVYVIATTAIGRFTQTDEIAFKAAGREWAQNGCFAAPELAGFGHFDPPVERIWFAHMPIYTFVFGVFVKLFGFGATQSVLFDTLIHAMLAALTFALCRRMSPSSSPWSSLAAAALILPLGTPGRADEFAVCLAMGALLADNLAVAGVLFGLSAATSLFAAGILGLHALVLLATRPRPLRAFAILAVTGALVAAACIAPIVVPHPEALRQFAAHAKKQITSSYAWSFGFAWTYGKHFFAAALLPLVIAIAARQRKGIGTRFAGGAAAVVLILLFVPAKYYYYWFVAPLLIAASCATIAERRVPRVAVAICAIVYFAAMLQPLRQLAILAALPREQRLAPNVAIIRSIVPRGSHLLASEFWSSIADDVQYRSLVHGSPDYDAIDYVVLTGNGSGEPGRTQSLTPEQAAAIAPRFVVVHDNLNRDVPRLFGIPLSHSAAGFGTRILRKR